MKRMLMVLSVLAAVFSAGSGLAEKRDLVPVPKVPAGSVPIGGEYWALIIGIDKYQHAPKLESAVKDAKGVRDVLTERYGFKKERIIELLNEQATGPKIQNALYQLGRRTGKEDSVFIYYAGHGQYDDEGRLGWWVPVEAQPKDPGTFIMDVSILNFVKGMNAKHVYLVADSCFSGTLFGTRALPPLNDQFFARLYAKPSRWGLTSGGTEPVADQGKNGHSIFAYHFINLLKENADPYLVPSHIYDQLAPLIANNADQTPRSEPLKGAGDEGGQFVFRLTSGNVPKKETPPASAATESTSTSEDMARVKEQLEELKKQVATSKTEDVKPPASQSPVTKQAGTAASIAQAQKELKTLEEQEHLAALQRQIEEKKKKLDEPRLRAEQAAREKEEQAQREAARQRAEEERRRVAEEKRKQDVEQARAKQEVIAKEEARLRAEWPTLEAVLGWLKSQINANTTSRDNGRVYMEVSSVSSCGIEIDMVVNRGDNGKRIHTDTYAVPLSQIDLHSFEIRPDSVAMALKDQDIEATMKFEYPPGKERNISVKRLGITVHDLDFAKKLADAFKFAAMLCQGRG